MCTNVMTKIEMVVQIVKREISSNENNVGAQNNADHDNIVSPPSIAQQL